MIPNKMNGTFSEQEFLLLKEQVARLTAIVEGKQGILTAGENITITDENVISASGGGGGGWFYPGMTPAVVFNQSVDAFLRVNLYDLVPNLREDSHLLIYNEFSPAYPLLVDLTDNDTGWGDEPLPQGSYMFIGGGVHFITGNSSEWAEVYSTVMPIGSGYGTDGIMTGIPRRASIGYNPPTPGVGLKFKIWMY